jgi:cytochrome c oxidase subunit II
MIGLKKLMSLGARTCVALLSTAAASAALAVNDLPGGPAVNQLDLRPPVTKLASEIQWLHNYVMIICVVIFIGVFGFMFYSILRHRKSKGAKAANFHESVTVEIAWTVVPFFIVIAMALPATKTVVAMKDTTNADITIKATGHQWKWGYDYLKGEGEGIGFYSTIDASHREMSNSGKPPSTDDYLQKVDNPLVVPVGKKIRVITTANDVIHAWMVPAFGVKQDAIPGFVRDTWFRAEKTGDYYGQCAELCGKEHAYMPIHVKVVTAEQYAKWAGDKQAELKAAADDPSKVWQLADLIARGEKVYAANCVACHLADGKGNPAAKIKALDGSALVVNDPLNQIKTLLNGAANGAMPAWKQLSDTELAAVATYTKNSWSNKTGKVIQPAEVADVRAGKTPATFATTTTAAAPAAAVVPAAAAPTVAAAATDGLPLPVYFAVGKSALDADAQKALGKAIEMLKGKPDTKIALSGYVDSSGSAAKNAELAKQRAFAVRDALTKAGVAAERIELRKPSQVDGGSGAAAERARRVDIVSAS